MFRGLRLKGHIDTRHEKKKKGKERRRNACYTYFKVIPFHIIRVAIFSNFHFDLILFPKSSALRTSFSDLVIVSIFERNHISLFFDLLVVSRHDL